MAVCTFFGHKDATLIPECILRLVITDLIEKKNVKMFYVGNQGNFDSCIRTMLKSIKVDYPNINYAVVLAYMPHQTDALRGDDYSDTIYPEGLENTLPRFAIIKRNEWMLDHSDYVVTYIKHSWGGAAKFKELAEKKGKTVINIPDLNK